MLNFAKRVDVRWYVCLAVLALIGLAVFLALPSKVSSVQAFEAEEVQDASVVAGGGNLVSSSAEKALTGLSLLPEGVYFDGPKRSASFITGVFS